MMFSIERGHFLSDAAALNLKLKKEEEKKTHIAQCAAVNAADLSTRGHRWYMAGI